MNTAILICFVAVVASAMASYEYNSHGSHGYGGRYGYGFERTGKGVEAVYNNAGRQKKVNHIAEHVGASSGTARYYGVPGTGRFFEGKGYAGGGR